MEPSKGASAHSGTSAAGAAPPASSMVNAEAAVGVASRREAAHAGIPNAASGPTSAYRSSPSSPTVRNGAQQHAEEKPVLVSKLAHPTGKKSRRKHHRKNKIEDGDEQIASAPLKGQGKTKSGHRRSQDDLATHKSPDGVRKHHRQNSGSKNDNGKPERAVNAAGATLNQLGSRDFSSDNATIGAAAPSGPAEKKSKKKRKKHHKAAGGAWDHLSETSNHADSKNGPNVAGMRASSGYSPNGAAAQGKPSDSAVIKETRVDAAWRATDVHQAVPAEAAPIEPLVPQVGTAHPSDDRKQQLDDLKKAAALKSKLQRQLPTTGGPFGGLSSTRSSSLDRSAGHPASEARTNGAKKEAPSLSPKQASLTTIANGGESHTELPEKRGTSSPSAQESAVKLNMPVLGGPFAGISETENEHPEPKWSQPSSSVFASANDAPEARKQPSALLHHVAGTGRRVSIAPPEWGGPFGGSPSFADHSSESLHSKVTAQAAEAEPVPQQESALDVAPPLPAPFKKEEEAQLPDRRAFSQSAVQKKVARHVLEETAFSVNSAGSEEGLDAQQHKASQSSDSSFESSLYKSSQGSVDPSPCPQLGKDERGPRRMRSMSLVLLEDAPLLLSQPAATDFPLPPPDITPSLPKLESPDHHQEAPIPPTTAAETEKGEKTAERGKKKKSLKKSKSKEAANAATSLFKDGHDRKKPALKSNDGQPCACSVDEINKRIEVLQCQQFDLVSSSGSHSPLRPVSFKQDHAVLTEKGEVKLCLDLSTREETEMLWPFDLEATMAKKQDP